MDISSVKRDSAAIEAGQWVGDIPGMGTLRLKVRGSGSAVYTATLSRLSRAVERAERNRDGSLKTEAATRVMGTAMHQAVLLDWDGLTDNGKPVPYDKELALTMLTSPDYRPFLDAVVFAASVVENGREQIEEDLGKN